MANPGMTAVLNRHQKNTRKICGKWCRCDNTIHSAHTLAWRMLGITLCSPALITGPGQPRWRDIYFSSCFHRCQSVFGWSHCSEPVEREIIKAGRLMQLWGRGSDKETRRAFSLSSSFNENLLQPVLGLIRFPPPPHNRVTQAPNLPHECGLVRSKLQHSLHTWTDSLHWQACSFSLPCSIKF